MHRGDIPAGRNVLHKCDVTACVNPDHLYLGGQADNMRDMHRRGRFPEAAKFGNAKLTREQGQSIRLDPRRTAIIAAEYGIAQAHVRRIQRGERWAAK